MLYRAASEVEYQPALELSKTPALIRSMRGAHHRRCAREGLTVTYYALLVGK